MLKLVQGGGFLELKFFDKLAVTSMTEDLEVSPRTGVGNRVKDG